METIGSRIKQARIKRQMTQGDLARRAYVTRQQINRYERGKSKPLSGVLASIANALDVSESWLRYGDEQSQDKKKEVKI